MFCLFFPHRTGVASFYVWQSSWPVLSSIASPSLEEEEEEEEEEENKRGNAPTAPASTGGGRRGPAGPAVGGRRVVDLRLVAALGLRVTDSLRRVAASLRVNWRRRRSVGRGLRRRIGQVARPLDVRRRHVVGAFGEGRAAVQPALAAQRLEIAAVLPVAPTAAVVEPRQAARVPATAEKLFGLSSFYGGFLLRLALRPTVCWGSLPPAKQLKLPVRSFQRHFQPFWGFVTPTKQLKPAPRLFE